MSLFDSASLVITPNGTKASKLYSIIPTDGGGDLTVTRATTATRVNSSGLIESVANNVPRLDYLNSTCPSILVEPQRTNLATYSEQFDNASWIKLNGSVNANTTISPSGNINADSFIPNTTSGLHALRSNNFNQSSTSSHSWFVKANGYSKIAVRESDLPIGNYASFNLSTGTLISTSQSGIIEDYGNGWYRCTLVDTNTGAGAQTSIFVLPDSYTTGNPLIAWSGDGIKGVFAYGAQVEIGSYATSYIPTVASSVTRNADVISKTGISSLIGTEFTLFLDAYETTGGNSSRYLILKGTGGTYANAVFLEANSSNQIALTILNSSSSAVFADLSTALTNGQRFKVAVRCKNNDFAFYLNGVQIATQASGTVPTTADLYLGYYSDYDNNYNKINSAVIWKEGLTNEQLATLTTI